MFLGHNTVGALTLNPKTPILMPCKIGLGLGLATNPFYKALKSPCSPAFYTDPEFGPLFGGFSISCCIL